MSVGQRRSTRPRRGAACRRARGRFCRQCAAARRTVPPCCGGPYRALGESALDGRRHGAPRAVPRRRSPGQSGGLGSAAALAGPGDGGLSVFAVLAVAELAVPVWAEQAAQTTWHPHHITERYGLFTLIVLGESVTAATVRAALDADAAFSDVASLTVGGVLTVSAMWWLYFARSTPEQLTSAGAALRWGYGHYAVFASAAAVGAGLAVGIAHATGHAHIGDTAAAAVYTLPVAFYLTVLRLLQRRSAPSRAQDALWAAAVLLVLAATPTASAVLITGIAASTLVAAVLVTVRRARTPGGPLGSTGTGISGSR
ncbi:low temperature requirement protein A [Streptomyces shenzhenensis]|uniref:low temperature requirement protein A n=1 Tax=Streptomyces shenzhenensis TaxID=943815 RepID=UPI0036C7A0EB